ncbi:MAG TPA: dockerin type I domain-containing protein [Phycisphaerales bacterium]|nr:dockerin type I domain-containing protein [Phycisphaerales bacterium]
MLKSTIFGGCLTFLVMFGAESGPSKSKTQTTSSIPVTTQRNPISLQDELAKFTADQPAARTMQRNNRVVRVYGPAFAHGGTAVASAQSFIDNHARMLGAESADLKPIGPFADQHNIQPIMYDAATGTYKFTGVYYSQVRDNVPVFRSRLTLLSRNVEGAPVVLASSDLRDLGNFSVAAAPQNINAVNLAHNNIQAEMPGLTEFDAARQVIYAGVDDVSVTPVLAYEFVASGINPATGLPDKWLIVANAANGAVLYKEPLILDFTDVSGNVSGMATTGTAADTCNPEAITPLPYTQVSIGATTVYGDANGNFTIPNAGTTSVSVNSTLRGHYFRVFNQNSANASLTQSVTPPGPVNFIHNSANTSEFNRAEVNAYLQANIVRDFALAANPSYPTLPGMTEFPLNVNINLTCNAYYDPISVSLNFYVAGGGCTNTANSTVVHHEFGHHLVQAAGSGQSGYGEGMGDCMAVCINDISCLGQGFQSCASCLRTADNTIQYPYNNSDPHETGRLLSGCIWSTRNALLAAYPSTYRQILGSLTVNSILLHTGTSIDPSITVDFLTLDDDNGDITDGTPHYTQIEAGFGAHNMHAPALAPIKFIYPNGRPDLVNPSGGPTLQVQVAALSGSPSPGTAQLHLNTGSGYITIPMTQTSTNNYEVAFPATTCGGIISYYVSAQAVGGQTVNSPGNAPTTAFTAVSATAAGPVAFADNFQTDMGWTVVNSGATAGLWQRGVPAGDGTRGDPTVDGDHSGSCYLTGNGAGDTDVDGGTTTLVSPTMDATIGQPILEYYRWYSNGAGADPHNDTFVVQISSNNGSSWTTLETVGPTGSEVDGGWFHKTFALAQVPGFALTNQFKVRFSASDLGSGSVVEAAVDGVNLNTYSCTPAVPGDVNGDGFVNIDDLTAVILAWGSCSGCPADLNHDGQVNIDDLTAVILGWT